MQKYFYIEILGCQYNYYDAKNITHQLEKMGYIYTSLQSRADIVVVLSCSVRQKPIDKLFGKIKNWQKESKKIFITGCVLEHDRKKLTKKGVIFTPCEEIENNLPNIKDIKNIEAKYFTPKNEPPDTAYVPIMQGCNNFCTYCAVPYTRGREVSRNTNDIIAEVRYEIAKGMKHIVLLGQNVNSYKLSADSSLRGTNKEIDDFTILLKQIDKLPGDFDYNFVSANPRNFSPSLIDFLPSSKKWNRYLHLPLQSGNNDLLKKMNRKYTVENYLSIIKILRNKSEKFKITTDIIVGFPGETKEQFDDTYNICKQIGFDGAYVAQYSPRPQTLAQKKYEDDVPRMEKKRRWAKLNKLINKR